MDDWVDINAPAEPDGGGWSGVLGQVGDWFGRAVDAYGRIEVAKINASSPFASPYAPVTYPSNPNAMPYDIRVLGGAMQQPAVVSSGTVMAAAALLVGLLVYVLAKK